LSEQLPKVDDSLVGIIEEGTEFYPQSGSDRESIGVVRLFPSA
jgi:hypothetical protein